MAIKAVEIIPDKTHIVSQRDIIRNDVQEAVNSNISQFEFIDDRYKYNTLVGNARDAIRNWFNREVYYPSDKKAKERLKSKISGTFWTPMGFEYEKKVFSLSKRKLNDRIHVYCTLNLDMIKNMEQIIYDDTLKLYAEKWPEQII